SRRGPGVGQSPRPDARRDGCRRRGRSAPLRRRAPPRRGSRARNRARLRLRRPRLERGALRDGGRAGAGRARRPLVRRGGDGRLRRLGPLHTAPRGARRTCGLERVLGGHGRPGRGRGPCFRAPSPSPSRLIDRLHTTIVARVTRVPPPNDTLVRNASVAATELIRNAIIEGRLEPGRRLKEEELARELGISRTPVREALLVLQAEDLVVATPNRGATVRV